MDAEGRIDEELARALEALAADARRSCEEARRTGTGKAIHEARSALRRLEVAIAVARALQLTDAGRSQRLERRVHALIRLLGDTRDDDVLIAKLARSHPRAAATKGVLVRLTRHRRKAFAAVEREMARRRTARLLRRVGRLPIASPRPRRGPSPSASIPPVLVRHRMAEALAHAHTGVAAFEGSLDDGASDETLHEVRRRVRTLRYVVELFAGAMPRRASRLIEDLRALQARLGDLHDDSAAVGRIEAWLDEGKALHDPETEAFLVRQRRARQKRRGGFFREWGVLTRGLRNRLGLQGDATPPNSV